MYARATGLFSIYRGTTTNASGDTIDDNTTATATGVPIALHNNSVTEESPNTESPRTISVYLGRATRTLDLRANDRIKDEATSVFYVVDGQPRAPLGSTRNSDLGFVAHRELASPRPFVKRERNTLRLIEKVGNSGSSMDLRHTSAWTAYARNSPTM
jgi:hypothetical protein